MPAPGRPPTPEPKTPPPAAVPRGALDRRQPVLAASRCSEPSQAVSPERTLLQRHPSPVQLPEPGASAPNQPVVEPGWRVVVVRR